MRDRTSLFFGFMLLRRARGQRGANRRLRRPLARSEFVLQRRRQRRPVRQRATFNNSFTDYGGGVTSWEGWAASDQTTTPATADLGQPDYTYQYSAAPGIGSRGSANYGVGFTNTFVLPAPIIQLPAGTHPVSLQVTNTTYDFLSMYYGDDFAKKFSGPVGDTPGDWFKLTITGLTGVAPNTQSIGSVDFYLADFRSANPAGLHRQLVAERQPREPVQRDLFVLRPVVV